MKNKSLLQKLFVLVFCFVLAAPCCYAQKKDNILANKIFNVEVTEKNLDGTEHKIKDDKIRFKTGKVRSDFSTRNGFADALYTLTVDSNSTPNEITFTAESSNEKKNTLKWSGTIKGDIIEGKATRTRTHAKGGDYVFSGTLKK